MTKHRNIQLNLEVGQKIRIGNKRDTATITKIEYFPKSGDVVLGTDHGSRNALTFSLCESANASSGNPADKYR